MPFTPPLQTIESEPLLPICSNENDNSFVNTDNDMAPKHSRDDSIRAPWEKQEHVKSTLNLLEGIDDGQPVEKQDRAPRDSHSPTNESPLLLKSRLSAVNTLDLEQLYPPGIDDDTTSRYSQLDGSSKDRPLSMELPGLRSHWSASTYSDVSPTVTRTVRHTSHTIKRPGTPLNIPEDVFSSPSEAHFAASGPFLSSLSLDENHPQPTISNAKAIEVLTGDLRGRDRTPQKDRTLERSVSRVPTVRERSRSRAVLDKLGGIFASKHEKNKKRAQHLMPSGSSTPPPIPRLPRAHVKPKPRIARLPLHASHVNLAQRPSTPRRSALRANKSSPCNTRTEQQIALDADSSALLARCLLAKAQRETSSAHRQRMADFASGLNESMELADEARRHAETAQRAASSAQSAYEKMKRKREVLTNLAWTLLEGEEQ